AGVLATVGGASAAGVRDAQNFGATLGARRYSQSFELEADALGTVIAFKAGYDPVRGAEYFARIPDPGNRFLGTHPPNASRIAVVRQVAAGLREAFCGPPPLHLARFQWHGVWRAAVGRGGPRRGVIRRLIAPYVPPLARASREHLRPRAPGTTLDEIVPLVRLAAVFARLRRDHVFL